MIKEQKFVHSVYVLSPRSGALSVVTVKTNGKYVLFSCCHAALQSTKHAVLGKVTYVFKGLLHFQTKIYVLKLVLPHKLHSYYAGIIENSNTNVR
jgi:hypothetical protein